MSVGVLRALAVLTGIACGASVVLTLTAIVVGAFSLAVSGYGLIFGFGVCAVGFGHLAEVKQDRRWRRRTSGSRGRRGRRRPRRVR